MQGLKTGELAKEFSLTPGRISQLVANGTLAGCYQGDGRQRRFDLDKAARALGKKLNPGQRLGNGAKTQKAIAKIAGSDSSGLENNRDGKTEPADPDRYELARIQKAEEEARKLRRQNAEAEGLYVLASEVALQTQRILGQEVAAFETVLRTAARKVADAHGVDFKAVRKIMFDVWRDHRADRAKSLEKSADEAAATDQEMSEDI